MLVWGELIKNGNRNEGVHKLQKSTVIIGRSSKADIKVSHSQISGQHCLLIRNEKTGRIVAIDKSSNGTLLQSSDAPLPKKMIKSTEHEIKDSDSIFLVKSNENKDELWFKLKLLAADRENILPAATEGVASSSDTEVEQSQGEPIMTQSSTSQPVSDANQHEQQHVSAGPPTLDRGEASQPSSSPREPPLLTQETATLSKPTGVASSSVPARKNTGNMLSDLEHQMNASIDQQKQDGEINDSMSLDLPDIDDILRPSYDASSPSTSATAVPPTLPKTSELQRPHFTFKVTTKRPADPIDTIVKSPTASSYPSVSKKPSMSQSPAFPRKASAPLSKPGGSFSKVAVTVVANNDDDDELPDIIPHFKPPPSVTELRTKPVVTSSSNTSLTSKPAAACGPSTMTAADRARKLMASTLPADFLQTADPSTGSGDNAEASTAEPSTSTATPSTSTAGMEDNLICSICQEIFYDPAGCLSGWLKQAKDCPQCRRKVEKVGEHHMIKNLAQCFLDAHPDRRRTKEELELMDQHNTITKNKKASPPKAGKGRGRGAQGSSYESSSSGEDSYFGNSDESYGSDDGLGSFLPDYGQLMEQMFAGLGRGRGRARGGRGRGAYGRGGASNAAAANAPWPHTCLQCPGGSLASAAATSCQSGRGRASRGGRGGVLLGHLSAAAWTSGTGNGNIAAPANIPPYTCTSDSHLVCYCCSQRFPDRQGEPGIPAVTCPLCHKTYCHLYWGCRRTSCQGCLGPVNAFKTTLLEIEGGLAVRTNTFEAQALADYLNSHSISPDAVLQVGYLLMSYNSLPDVNISADSAVCRLCFKNQVVPSIAYAYRAQLTSSDLPPAITSRPNCQWGKECRTQKRSVPHARKNNHICVAAAANPGQAVQQAGPSTSH